MPGSISSFYNPRVVLEATAMNEPRVMRCRSCLSAMAFFICPAVSFSQADSSTNSRITLTNLQQVVNLKSNQLDSARYQAQVRGLIVHVWPASRRIYLQQGNLGLEVGLASS